MTCYRWAVIGAGPAGISAVGKLLDDGVSGKDILWLDPYFKVGDLGRLWAKVPSNTKVKYFIRFLESIESFDYQPNEFRLSHLPEEKTCLLSDMVEPLQSITEQLKTRVNHRQEYAQSLLLTQRQWQINTTHHQYRAKKIITASGANPKTLNYPETPSIPLSVAMDKERLSQAITPNETIAVFGSSHSAVLILKNLVELNTKKIINFYRKPCLYAIDMGDWILHDNTGLKGIAAEWAREHIDGQLPENLIRLHSIEDNILRHLPQCDKAIHAIGFSKRNNIVLKHYENADYNPSNGIIAPGLFGFGIAYPEQIIDSSGFRDYRVGLWKFMDYLKRAMPLWHRYGFD